jgi:single-strand selective monofunctional uracil DNA glycosylase
MRAITDSLVRAVASLTFGAPVAYVYNPLVYARTGYDAYCQRFGQTPKEVLLLGMNPGPWGMAQTGVPFGDARMVSGWMGLAVTVRPPARQHPKRPVQGLACPRGEVSGQRLWGWARQRFGPAERFFEHFWVANYCPLVFMEESGRNRTPDKLSKGERSKLFEACDKALYESVELLKPTWVIGVGRFARERAAAALQGMNLTIAGITHPSPANPRANRGWNRLAESELAALGVLREPLAPGRPKQPGK